MDNKPKSNFTAMLATGIGATILLVVIVVVIYRYSYAYKMWAQTSLTVDLNQKTRTTNLQMFPLRDFYIMGSYNTCVEGPYNRGIVSITYLKNAIALGYRFLDFEIYSSSTDDPVVSCSTYSTEGGTYANSFYSLPFVDVLKTINTYAFTNSGCMNFRDPLIVNLRIKTCNLNVITKLTEIFKEHGNKMLGPEYSYNKNNSNFGDTPLNNLMGKICLFVDSSSVDYSSNTGFMEYVNSSTITGFLKETTQTEFKNAPSLQDMIEYNKRNMTVIIPDYKNPKNSVLQAYQNAGCQIVAMMIWQTGSYLSENNDYFSKHQFSFVLKPEQFRYIPQTIPAPKPQAPQNSYSSRPLDTGVAGIAFNI
jgi:hypothetical protein